MNDKRRGGAAEFNRAIRPELTKDFQPLDDLPAEVSLAKVLRVSQLGNQTLGAKKGNISARLGGPRSPGEPDVKVEIAGGVGEGAYYVQVQRDGVFLSLAPELLGEHDEIFAPRLALLVLSMSSELKYQRRRSLTKRKLCAR